MEPDSSAPERIDRPPASGVSRGALTIVLLVAIVAVGSVVIGAVFLLRSDGDGAATPSGSVSPDADPSSATGWALNDLGTSGALTDVAVGSGGLVAVGYGTWAETSQVWTSADGATWAMAPAQPSLDRGAMLSVANGPAGLVAVGRPCSEGDCEGAPIWRSQDGLGWTAVDGPRFSSWDLSSVVDFGGRYFAGGSIDGEAGVIASADGAIWQAVWQDPRRSASGGASLAAGYASALTTFAGGIVAFADVDRTLRVSPDGETWHAVTTPDDVRYIASMVAWGSGLVAIGVDREGASAVWHVDDALSWQRVADVGGEASDVVVVDGVLLVADHAPDGVPSLLRSTDGEAWETAALPAAAGVGSYIASLMPFGREVVAAGSAGGETVEQTRAAVWRGPAP